MSEITRGIMEMPYSMPITAEFSQFLSAVMDAAGLVRHGRRSKELSEYLGQQCMKYRAEFAPTPLASEQQAHECTCVYATAKNTAAVRNGSEMGGYLKTECEACRQRRSEQPASEQQQAVVMSAAAADVLAERRRQVEKEGWSTEHDEEHDAGVLAAGAAAYALNAVDQLHPLSQGANAHKQPACWPWAHAYWKPGVPRRDLVKAGALILAEIERWDRTISHPAGVNQRVTTEAGNGGDL